MKLGCALLVEVVKYQTLFASLVEFVPRNHYAKAQTSKFILYTTFLRFILVIFVYFKVP